MHILLIITTQAGRTLYQHRKHRKHRKRKKKVHNKSLYLKNRQILKSSNSSEQNSKMIYV